MRKPQTVAVPLLLVPVILLLGGFAYFFFGAAQDPNRVEKTTFYYLEARIPEAFLPLDAVLLERHSVLTTASKHSFPKEGFDSSDFSRRDYRLEKRSDGTVLVFESPLRFDRSAKRNGIFVHVGRNRSFGFVFRPAPPESEAWSDWTRPSLRSGDDPGFGFLAGNDDAYLPGPALSPPVPELRFRSKVFPGGSPDELGEFYRLNEP